EMNVADRYTDITGMFDSIREDTKTRLASVEDGKFTLGERVQYMWMRIRRGTPAKRFNKIVGVYNDVASDTDEQLSKEKVVLKGYSDFRLALKSSEGLAFEVLQVQLKNYDRAHNDFAAATKVVETYKGDVSLPEHSRLQLARDEAGRAFKVEERRYQLLKDVADNIQVGYNIGESLIDKLQQTHDVKDQLYRKAVVFFSTNEHVYTLLSALYTSTFGLNEAARTVAAMQRGAEEAIKDVATIGTKVATDALEPAYGRTIGADAVKVLVDSIVQFQQDSLPLIDKYRKEATENADEITRIVEDGKKRVHEVAGQYLLSAANPPRLAAPKGE
ncbi:MAG: cell surface protein, partial [Nanoarchaeota archaeon]